MAPTEGKQTSDREVQISEENKSSSDLRISSSGQSQCGSTITILSQTSDSIGTTRKWTQVLACVGAALGQTCAGTVSGWSGAVLPAIQADPVIAPTISQSAWIVSVMPLGAILGGLVAGWLMDSLGRRTTLLITVPMFLTMWATLAFAHTIWMLILGRAAGGFATGLVLTSSQVFTSEACESHLRGKMSSIPTLCFTLGTLTSYTSGALLSWRMSCIPCASVCVPMVAILMLSPETPYWLLLKGRDEEAEKSLKWLRGTKCDLVSQLKGMKEKIDSVGAKVDYRELMHPRTRGPLIIALFMQGVQQLCGGTLLFFYTTTIYQASGQPQSQFAAVYTGMAQLASSGFSLLLVDRVGRKVLLSASTTSVGLSLLCFGGYQIMYESGVETWSWTPLLLSIITVSTYCLGCRSVPLILSAELFNTSSRSRAQAVCMVANRAFNMVVMQSFPLLMASVGLSTVFFCHGILSLVFSLVTFIWLPETKNKSLEEIQEFFEERAAIKKNMVKK